MLNDSFILTFLVWFLIFFLFILGLLLMILRVCHNSSRCSVKIIGYGFYDVLWVCFSFTNIPCFTCSKPHSLLLFYKSLFNINVDFISSNLFPNILLMTNCRKIVLQRSQFVNCLQSFHSKQNRTLFWWIKKLLHQHDEAVWKII